MSFMPREEVVSYHSVAGSVTREHRGTVVYTFCISTPVFSRPPHPSNPHNVIRPTHTVSRNGCKYCHREPSFVLNGLSCFRCQPRDDRFPPPPPPGLSALARAPSTTRQTLTASYISPAKADSYVTMRTSASGEGEVRRSLVVARGPLYCWPVRGRPLRKSWPGELLHWFFFRWGGRRCWVSGE